LVVCGTLVEIVGLRKRSFLLLGFM